MSELHTPMVYVYKPDQEVKTRENMKRLVELLLRLVRNNNFEVHFHALDEMPADVKAFMFNHDHLELSEKGKELMKGCEELINGFPEKFEDEGDDEFNLGLDDWK